MENLESYFSKVKDQLTSKEDSLVILYHWAAISNNLQCAGIGENWASDTEVIQSDIPPENWNCDQRCYLIRYLDENKNRFLLEVKIEEYGSFLYAKLINVDTSCWCGTILNIDESVGDSFNEFNTAYKQVVSTINSIKYMITSVMKSAEE